MIDPGSKFAKNEDAPFLAALFYLDVLSFF
jgi:hypothetical protein